MTQTPTQDTVQRLLALLAAPPPPLAGLLADCALTAEQAQEIAATLQLLQAMVTRLSTPTLFWPDDSPEDGTCDWSDYLADLDADAVVKFSTAHDLPPVWGATRVLAVDGDGEPLDCDTALFKTQAEAMDCFPTSLADARRAATQPVAAK